MRDIINENTKNAIKNIERSQQILDQLINTSDDVQELRSIKKKLSTIISDLKDKNLGQFSNKTSSMNDFTTAEEYFVHAFEDFADELEKQSPQVVNTKNIKILLNSLEDGVSSRLVPDNELKKQFTESGTKKTTPNISIPSELKNEVHLYFNMLQTKYSKNRPEVLFGGDYVDGLNWKFNREEDNIVAKLGSMFDTPLILEARFQQKDEKLVDQIQKEANSVKQNQHKCLCLINNSWNREIEDFVGQFVHPNFVLYLYGLTDGVIYNRENKMAEHYAFWFNTEPIKQKLNDYVRDFLEENKYFTEHEVAETLGLNVKGTKKLLKGLINSGIIIDVSFESDESKKYTKAKPKD